MKAVIDYFRLETEVLKFLYLKFLPHMFYVKFCMCPEHTWVFMWDVRYCCPVVPKIRED